MRSVQNIENMYRTECIIGSYRACRKVQVVQSLFLPFPLSVYPWQDLDHTIKPRHWTRRSRVHRRLKPPRRGRKHSWECSALGDIWKSGGSIERITHFSTSEGNKGKIPSQTLPSRNGASSSPWSRR